MDPDDIVAMKTYVPAKDFDLSTQFYQDLGFSIIKEGPDIRVLQMGSVQFILQNFYQQDLANNLMMQLVVKDLDAWWQHIRDTNLLRRYKGVGATPPKQYPWGLREIQLNDPSGVLWHIAQSPNDS